MVWIKGRACGVDNCASTFYQVLAGQRVCQYGHVQAGAETVADESERQQYGFARRIGARAQRAGARQSPFVHGRASRELELALLQDAYKRSVAHTARRLRLPPAFARVAKELWFLHLRGTAYFGPRPVRMSFDLVALQYLAARFVGAPVLLAEFHLLLHERFPYGDAHCLVDAARAARLTRPARSALTARAGPKALHAAVRRVRAGLRRAFGLRWPPLEPASVYYRLARYLLAPPEVAVAALRLHAGFCEHARRRADLWLEDGLAYLPLFAAALKMYYPLDGVARQVPAAREGEMPNLGVWTDFMRKLWLQGPDFVFADPLAAQYWPPETQLEYARWARAIHGKEPDDRRLRALFPPSADTVEDVSAGPQAADPDVLADMAALLYSTAEPPRPAAVRMGEQYHAYADTTSRTEPPPEPIVCLQLVLAKLLGTSLSQSHLWMQLCERWMRKHAVVE